MARINLVLLSASLLAAPPAFAMPVPETVMATASDGQVQRPDLIHNASAMFGLAQDDRLPASDASATKVAAPTDWTRRMVRPCVRSGNKVNC